MLLGARSSRLPPQKKQKALFWVPAWTLSAPNSPQKLPMDGSAREGNSNGKPVFFSPRLQKE